MQQPRAVTMRVSHSLTGASVSARCDTALTQAADQQYISYCALASLPDSWFQWAAARVAVNATVEVTLRDAADSSDVASSIHLLELQLQPLWFAPSLRSDALGSTRTAPTGLGLATGGLFLTLPTSPLYASEVFEGYLYAHTGGLALNSMTISLRYNSSLIEYVSYQQSSHFNGAVFDAAQPDRLAWVITGRSSAASAQDVTGEAIYLLRVRLRFRASTPPAGYSGEVLNLSPYAHSFVSNANLEFVVGSAGWVCSAPDAPQLHATLSVRAPRVVGIMAAAASPVLFNSAVLDGQVSMRPIRAHPHPFRPATDPGVPVNALSATVRQAVTLPISAVSIRSSDLTLNDITSAAVTACAAISPEDAASRFSLAVSNSACELSVALPNAGFTGLSDASLRVEAAGESTSFQLWLYGAPGGVRLRADDHTLNRIDDAFGAAIGTCGAAPYQRTQLYATLGEFIDATALVRFRHTNTNGAATAPHSCLRTRYRSLA